MSFSIAIFTDLDGTLLDVATYSWEAARPALELIRQRAIPLILCSSKTRTEIEALRQQLDNHDPFISENGGGIFIPNGYFDFSFSFQKKVSHYQVIELGTPYARLREAFLLITQQTGIHLKGYGDLSAGEISAQTGLSIQDAQLSTQREYDEPFFFMGTDEQRKRILQIIEEMGLNWSRGSRFDHLTGANDKGKAVNILKGLFEQKLGKVTTVALGDSPNDLPMLKAVDYPILVQKAGGQYEDSIQLYNLIKAEGIGPEGWKKAIFRLLASLAG
jgi:mannosyl-3-phosphoglycerate phosphatase